MSKFACVCAANWIHVAGAALGAAALLLGHPARAGNLQVVIIGADGHPVLEAVATATPLQAPLQAQMRGRDRPAAVMDQITKAFVPQVLVIGRGTWVEFPNSDTVSHQVYSFSPVKRFQLPLYKGVVRPPVQFDQPGLVLNSDDTCPSVTNRPETGS